MCEVSRLLREHNSVLKKCIMILTACKGCRLILWIIMI